MDGDGKEVDGDTSRGANAPRGTPTGILRVDSGKSRRTSLDIKLLSQNEPASPQPSVDRLSVTFADDSQRSDRTEPSPRSMDKVHFPAANTDEENSEDEDYSASVTAIMQRRASTRRSKKRSGRRGSSPFSPDILPENENGRRRSSVFTTSSGDTAITMEDSFTPSVTQDQIFENIKLHKEVLGSVKMQPWNMRKKLRLVVQAKSYIKKHEGALQERLAQSHSTRDMLARCNIYLIKVWQQCKREGANLSNWLIPWELRIKEIESHFGSVVASYFIFLRWLFWVNMVISIVLIAFVAVPEMLMADFKKDPERKAILPEDRYNSTNFLTLWDFEGVFKYSPMFYGWYTNLDLEDKAYRLPLAYFFTGLAVYVYSFVATLRKMAKNSRMSKLSEKEDECIFSWKLFTGWDYMIGNAETAHNRVASIVMSFKEALLEEAEKKRESKSWKLIGSRILVNTGVLGLLFLSAFAVVTVVARSNEKEANSTTWRRNEITVVMSLISLFFPIFFELLGYFEHYHPRKQLRLQLARIMVLNLLNLYSLIFALFGKISNMTRDLQVLKPPNTTRVPFNYNATSPIYTTLPTQSTEAYFNSCYTICEQNGLEAANLISSALTNWTHFILPTISSSPENITQSIERAINNATQSFPVNLGDAFKLDLSSFRDKIQEFIDNITDEGKWDHFPTSTSTSTTTEAATTITTPLTTIMEEITSTIKVNTTNCRLHCETFNETVKLPVLSGYERRSRLRSLCWETMFGQELMKLTVMDLVMTVLSTLAIDFLRGLFVRYMNNCWCWDLEKTFPQYGDFKVAENILHLVNNQGMVWMGMFFSPGLVVLNVFKLYVMMYLRSWAVLACNVPHEIIFRASRSNNFYFALLLSMLFLCVLPVGYTIVWLEPSWHCGPFSKYHRIFHIFTKTIRKALPEPFHKILDYIASPGIVIPLLVLLVLIIYYLISLTNALREANNDLKIQLRRERTEERRKMFQIADKRLRRSASGGSSELNQFGKWKKLLQGMPGGGKSFEDTPKEISEIEDLQQKAAKRVLSRFIFRSIKNKKQSVSDEDSVLHQDDGTDTEQHESLPDDASFRLRPFKLDSIEAGDKPFRKSDSVDKKLRKLDSLVRSSTDSGEKHAAIKNYQRKKDVINRVDSISSNWSENIPVITISKTESSECILEAVDNQEVETKTLKKQVSEINRQDDTSRSKALKLLRSKFGGGNEKLKSESVEGKDGCGLVYKSVDGEEEIDGRKKGRRKNKDDGKTKRVRRSKIKQGNEDKVEVIVEKDLDQPLNESKASRFIQHFFKSGPSDKKKVNDKEIVEGIKRDDDGAEKSKRKDKRRKEEKKTGKVEKAIINKPETIGEEKTTGRTFKFPLLKKEKFSKSIRDDSKDSLEETTKVLINNEAEQLSKSIRDEAEIITKSTGEDPKHPQKLAKVLIEKDKLVKDDQNITTEKVKNMQKVKTKNARGDVEYNPKTNEDKKVKKVKKDRLLKSIRDYQNKTTEDTSELKEEEKNISRSVKADKVLIKSKHAEDEAKITSKPVEHNARSKIKKDRNKLLKSIRDYQKKAEDEMDSKRQEKKTSKPFEEDTQIVLIHSKCEQDEAKINPKTIREDLKNLEGKENKFLINKNDEEAEINPKPIRDDLKNLEEKEITFLINRNDEAEVSPKPIRDDSKNLEEKEKIKILIDRNDEEEIRPKHIGDNSKDLEVVNNKKVEAKESQNVINNDAKNLGDENMTVLIHKNDAKSNQDDQNNQQESKHSGEDVKKVLKDDSKNLTKVLINKETEKALKSIIDNSKHLIEAKELSAFIAGKAENTSKSIKDNPKGYKEDKESLRDESKYLDEGKIKNKSKNDDPDIKALLGNKEDEEKIRPTTCRDDSKGIEDERFDEEDNNEGKIKPTTCRDDLKGIGDEIIDKEENNEGKIEPTIRKDNLKGTGDEKIVKKENNFTDDEEKSLHQQQTEVLSNIEGNTFSKSIVDTRKDPQDSEELPGLITDHTDGGKDSKEAKSKVSIHVDGEKFEDSVYEDEKFKDSLHENVNSEGKKLSDPKSTQIEINKDDANKILIEAHSKNIEKSLQDGAKTLTSNNEDGTQILKGIEDNEINEDENLMHKVGKKINESIQDPENSSQNEEKDFQAKIIVEKRGDDLIPIRSEKETPEEQKNYFFEKSEALKLENLEDEIWKSSKDQCKDTKVIKDGVKSLQQHKLDGKCLGLTLEQPKDDIEASEKLKLNSFGESKTFQQENLEDEVLQSSGSSRDECRDTKLYKEGVKSLQEHKVDGKYLDKTTDEIKNLETLKGEIKNDTPLQLTRVSLKDQQKEDEKLKIEKSKDLRKPDDKQIPQITSNLDSAQKTAAETFGTDLKHSKLDYASGTITKISAPLKPDADEVNISKTDSIIFKTDSEDSKLENVLKSDIKTSGNDFEHLKINPKTDLVQSKVDDDLVTNTITSGIDLGTLKPDTSTENFENIEKSGLKKSEGKEKEKIKDKKKSGTEKKDKRFSFMEKTGISKLFNRSGKAETLKVDLEKAKGSKKDLESPQRSSAPRDLKLEFQNIIDTAGIGIQNTNKDIEGENSAPDKSKMVKINQNVDDEKSAEVIKSVSNEEKSNLVSNEGKSTKSLMDSSEQKSNEGKLEKSLMDLEVENKELIKTDGLDNINLNKLSVEEIDASKPCRVDEDRISSQLANVFPKFEQTEVTEDKDTFKKSKEDVENLFTAETSRMEEATDNVDKSQMKEFSILEKPVLSKSTEIEKAKSLMDFNLDESKLGNDDKGENQKTFTIVSKKLKPTEDKVEVQKLSKHSESFKQSQLEDAASKIQKTNLETYNLKSTSKNSTQNLGKSQDDFPKLDYLKENTLQLDELRLDIQKTNAVEPQNTTSKIDESKDKTLQLDNLSLDIKKPQDRTSKIDELKKNTLQVDNLGLDVQKPQDYASKIDEIRETNSQAQNFDHFGLEENTRDFQKSDSERSQLKENSALMYKKKLQENPLEGFNLEKGLVQKFDLKGEEVSISDATNVLEIGQSDSKLCDDETTKIKSLEGLKTLDAKNIPGVKSKEDFRGSKEDSTIRSKIKMECGLDDKIENSSDAKIIEAELDDKIKIAGYSKITNAENISKGEALSEIITENISDDKINEDEILTFLKAGNVSDIRESNKYEISMKSVTDDKIQGKENISDVEFKESKESILRTESISEIEGSRSKNKSDTNLDDTTVNQKTNLDDITINPKLFKDGKGKTTPKIHSETEPNPEIFDRCLRMESDDDDDDSNPSKKSTEEHFGTDLNKIIWDRSAEVIKADISRNPNTKRNFEDGSNDFKNKPNKFLKDEEENREEIDLHQIDEEGEMSKNINKSDEASNQYLKTIPEDGANLDYTSMHLKNPTGVKKVRKSVLKREESICDFNFSLDEISENLSDNKTPSDDAEEVKLPLQLEEKITIKDSKSSDRIKSVFDTTEDFWAPSNNAKNLSLNEKLISAPSSVLEEVNKSSESILQSICSDNNAEKGFLNTFFPLDEGNLSKSSTSILEEPDQFIERSVELESKNTSTSVPKTFSSNIRKDSEEDFTKSSKNIKKENVTNILQSDEDKISKQTSLESSILDDEKPNIFVSEQLHQSFEDASNLEPKIVAKANLLSEGTVEDDSRNISTSESKMFVPAIRTDSEKDFLKPSENINNKKGPNIFQSDEQKISKKTSSESSALVEEKPKVFLKEQLQQSFEDASKDSSKLEPKIIVSDISKANQLSEKTVEDDSRNISTSESKMFVPAIRTDSEKDFLKPSETINNKKGPNIFQSDEQNISKKTSSESSALVEEKPKVFPREQLYQSFEDSLKDSSKVEPKIIVSDIEKAYQLSEKTVEDDSRNPSTSESTIFVSDIKKDSEKDFLRSTKNINNKKGPNIFQSDEQKISKKTPSESSALVEEKPKVFSREQLQQSFKDSSKTVEDDSRNPSTSESTKFVSDITKDSKKDFLRPSENINNKKGPNIFQSDEHKISKKTSLESSTLAEEKPTVFQREQLQRPFEDFSKDTSKLEPKIVAKADQLSEKTVEDDSRKPSTSKSTIFISDVRNESDKDFLTPTKNIDSEIVTNTSQTDEQNFSKKIKSDFSSLVEEKPFTLVKEKPLNLIEAKPNVFLREQLHQTFEGTLKLGPKIVLSNIGKDSGEDFSGRNIDDKIISQSNKNKISVKDFSKTPSESTNLVQEEANLFPKEQLLISTKDVPKNTSTIKISVKDFSKTPSESSNLVQEEANLFPKEQLLLSTKDVPKNTSTTNISVKNFSITPSESSNLVQEEANMFPKEQLVLSTQDVSRNTPTTKISVKDVSKTPPESTNLVQEEANLFPKEQLVLSTKDVPKNTSATKISVEDFSKTSSESSNLLQEEANLFSKEQLLLSTKDVLKNTLTTSELSGVNVNTPNLDSVRKTERVTTEISQSDKGKISPSELKLLVSNTETSFAVNFTESVENIAAKSVLNDEQKMSYKTCSRIPPSFQGEANSFLEEKLLQPTENASKKILASEKALTGIDTTIKFDENTLESEKDISRKGLLNISPINEKEIPKSVLDDEQNISYNASSGFLASFQGQANSFLEEILPQPTEDALKKILASEEMLTVIDTKNEFDENSSESEKEISRKRLLNISRMNEKEIPEKDSENSSSKRFTENAMRKILDSEETPVVIATTNKFDENSLESEKEITRKGLLNISPMNEKDSENTSSKHFTEDALRKILASEEMLTIIDAQNKLDKNSLKSKKEITGKDLLNISPMNDKVIPAKNSENSSSKQIKVNISTPSLNSSEKNTFAVIKIDSREDFSKTSSTDKKKTEDLKFLKANKSTTNNESEEDFSKTSLTDKKKIKDTEFVKANKTTSIKDSEENFSKTSSIDKKKTEDSEFLQANKSTSIKHSGEDFSKTSSKDTNKPEDSEYLKANKSTSFKESEEDFSTDKKKTKDSEFLKANKSTSIKDSEKDCSKTSSRDKKKIKDSELLMANKNTSIKHSEEDFSKTSSINKNKIEDSEFFKANKSTSIKDSKKEFSKTYSTEDTKFPKANKITLIKDSEKDFSKISSAEDIEFFKANKSTSIKHSEKDITKMSSTEGKKIEDAEFFEVQTASNQKNILSNNENGSEKVCSGSSNYAENLLHKNPQSSEADKQKPSEFSEEKSLKKKPTSIFNKLRKFKPGKTKKEKKLEDTPLERKLEEKLDILSPISFKFKHKLDATSSTKVLLETVSDQAVATLKTLEKIAEIVSVDNEKGDDEDKEILEMEDIYKHELMLIDVTSEKETGESSKEFDVKTEKENNDLKGVSYDKTPMDFKTGTKPKDKRYENIKYKNLTHDVESLSLQTSTKSKKFITGKENQKIDFEGVKMFENKSTKMEINIKADEIKTEALIKENPKPKELSVDKTNPQSKSKTYPVVVLEHFKPINLRGNNLNVPQNPIDPNFKYFDRVENLKTPKLDPFVWDSDVQNFGKGVKDKNLQLDEASKPNPYISGEDSNKIKIPKLNVIACDDSKNKFENGESIIIQKLIEEKFSPKIITTNINPNKLQGQLVSPNNKINQPFDEEQKESKNFELFSESSEDDPNPLTEINSESSNSENSEDNAKFSTIKRGKMLKDFKHDTNETESSTEYKDSNIFT